MLLMQIAVWPKFLKGIALSGKIITVENPDLGHPDELEGDPIGPAHR